MQIFEKKHFRITNKIIMTKTTQQIIEYIEILSKRNNDILVDGSGNNFDINRAGYIIEGKAIMAKEALIVIKELQEENKKLQ